MNVESWTRVRALFEEALNLPPAERPRFLEESSADKPEVRAQVRKLLDVESGMHESFLECEAEIPGIDELLDEAHPESMAGQRIGPFEIVRPLGSGGMGVVFEAQQEQPRRRVALKTLRGGYASKESLHRFRNEFQLLAQLEHPGIARMYDAGTHERNGMALPYYTMELVEGGRSLTEYAREEGLDTKARLRLFEKIAMAVDHGHKKGVIHRDLKPGNILVNVRGEPKVIDFGLARPDDADALGVSLVETRAGNVFGTLPYMSPEHISGLPLAIDVQSDVFSLGCILWELLSGAPPHDVANMGLPAAILRIQEEDPRPDMSLPQELRWILLKAVERDPKRRYASAADFGQDLNRYLQREPIEAAPPSTWYRLRRTARKHRAFLVGTGAVVLALGIGLVRANRATKRSEEARGEAEFQASIASSVNTFLGNMFDSLDAYKSGVDVKVREILDAHMDKLSDLEDPRVRAIATGFIGQGYMRLGNMSKAEGLLQEAVESAAEHFLEYSEYRLQVECLWADYLELTGRYQESTDLSREILPRVEKVFGEQSETTAYLRTNLATCYMRIGEPAAAEVIYRENLERARRQDPQQPAILVNCLHRLGQALVAQTRFDAAQVPYREALEIATRELGEDNMYVTTIRMDLASTMLNGGDPDQAEREFRRCRESYLRLDATERNRFAIAYNLAEALLAQNRIKEAAVFLAEAVSFADSYGPPPAVSHIRTLLLRGRMQVARGDLEQGAATIAAAETMCQEGFGSLKPFKEAFETAHNERAQAEKER